MTPANIEILTVTVFALAEPVTANQLVGFDGGPAMADEPVLGIAKTNGGLNEPLAVVTIGVVELVSAANLAAGDRSMPMQTACQQTSVPIIRLALS